MEESAFEQFHQSYRNQRGFVPETTSDSSAMGAMALSAHVGKGHFTSQKIRPGLRLSTADWHVYNKRIDVLLDEATASLDPENETAVQQAINELVANKTVIIIAHHLKTIQNADKILVLE
ncbi:hypothetical protein ET33_17425 [Paenibacillus tyrfis]|uniref:ABC transporter domain-containing protein n=1 Tax=Paenibacillus tyrfis TaxID=1501230 RepID=A0A081NXH9_9BACL|nr:hypothetical protein ET33_17425 [Paenibacillus tyrfis]